MAQPRRQQARWKDTSLSLSGIIPPMATPFTERGTIDTDAFREEVHYLIDMDVHGLAVGDSTGEGQTLTADEIWSLAEIAVQEADGRVPVIAGLIVNSTRQAVLRGRMLRDVGIAALLVPPVHYLFAPDEAGFYDYYSTIGSEVGLPVLINNGVPWSYASPEVLTRIVWEVDEVVGVKQGTGDLHALAELQVRLLGRGLVMASVDDLLYSSFCLGAKGAITAILTAVPGVCLDLWGAVQEGWHSEAQDLHERLLWVWMSLRGPNLPARVKAAMRVQGRSGGLVRAPMNPPSPEEEEEIRIALQEAGVL